VRLVEERREPRASLGKLLAFSCYAISLLSAFLVVLIFLLIKKSPEQVDLNKDICTSKACIKAGQYLINIKGTKNNHLLKSVVFSKAHLIMDNVNFSADPCDDFYEFACGGYVARTRLTDKQSRAGTFDKLDEELSYLLGGDLRKKRIQN
jgi:hypothetical protein